MRKEGSNDGDFDGNDASLCSLFDVNVAQGDTTEGGGNREGKVEYEVKCQVDFMVGKSELINAQMSDRNLKIF